MNGPAALLIVGEVRLLRDGLAQLFRSDGRVQVAGCLERIEPGTIPPPGTDAVLVDMAGRDALIQVRILRADAPSLPVIALGVTEIEPEIIACAEAGVAGYVARDACLEQLVETVQSTMRGEVLVSPRAAAALFRRLAQGRLDTPPDADGPGLGMLTRREQEVLDLMSSGLSNKEIGARLGIELCTVKNHVHRVLEKLGVHRRVEAVSRLRHLGATRVWGQRRGWSSGAPA